jgi:hypothetical protein
MNTPQTLRDERHEPSAAFVSSLEREIVRTYREQSRSPVVGVSRWGSRLRAASLLMTGLVLGAGAPLASAQVAGVTTAHTIGARGGGGSSTGGCPTRAGAGES